MELKLDYLKASLTMPLFKGSIHIHSTWSSDGALSLENLRDAYIASGFHFLMLSEHREDFSPERYRKLVSECETLNRDNFLLIPGLEYHHEAVSLCGLQSYPGSEVPLYDLLPQAYSQGSFNVLVHPSNLRELPSKALLSKLHAVEVWNLRYDGARLPSYKNLAIWRRLSGDFPLTPVFGIDFHEKEGIGTTWLQVELERLSSENLLCGLRNGRFRLFAGNKEWQIDGIGTKRNFQILAYYCLRWFALRNYRKIRHFLPQKLNNHIKKIVNG